MARMIFVNLPVKDVTVSRAFFGALGFGVNEAFSDERTVSVVVEENIVVMLLEHDRFKDFITGDVADATTSTEVLLCLSADSREAVDDLVARAVAAGGKPWLPSQGEGPMYGGSFQDPDGHVWEVMWMDPAAIPAS